MKISNKKTTGKVGRPSLRSFTVRLSDHHITFGSKAIEELTLHIGTKIDILFEEKGIFLCVDTKNGPKLFGYRNGSKYTSLACTANNIVTKLLALAKAEKVATFLISANSQTKDSYKFYKVINTPFRVD